jgi:hypothetical protein
MDAETGEPVRSVSFDGSWAGSEPPLRRLRSAFCSSLHFSRSDSRSDSGCACGVRAELLQRSVRGAKNKRQLATQNVFPAYTSVRYTCVRDHARDINSNMSDYLFIQNLHICSVAWTAPNSPSYHLGGRYSVSACACARTVCYLSAVVAHIAFAANCQSPASGPQG